MRLREEYGRPSSKTTGSFVGRRPGRRVVASAGVDGGPNGGRASAPGGAVGEEGAHDVDVAALARQHERGDAFSVLRWTNGGGAGRATRSGVVVAPGGARRGWLAGDPGAGARGTRDGRGGRDGDAARGSRGRPTWNPGSAPSRSAASTASASPALAARSNRRELIAADGAAGRGAKCDASIRAPSIRVASTGTPASFGASRFRPGAFTDRRLALVSVERRFLKASSVRRRVDSSDPTRGPF